MIFWGWLFACTAEKAVNERPDAGNTHTVPEQPDAPTQPEYTWDCDRQVEGFPWEEEGFWEEEGPLGPLLMPTVLPEEPHWELRRATSSDRLHWTPDPTVYAIHLSSLSLFPLEEGVLLLVSVDNLKAQAVGVPAGETRSLQLIASRDLQKWSSHTYRVMTEETDLLTDPSWWVDGAGALRGLWYAQPWDPENPGVPEGEHRLDAAVWDGGCFAEPAPVYRGENLLDPVLCQHPSRGDWWLLSTTTALKVDGASSNDPASFTHQFTAERGSVPFCYPDGNALGVLSQSPDGLYSVIRGEIAEDGQYREVGPLYEGSLFSNCTAPVLSKKGENWTLWCAVWEEP